MGNSIESVNETDSVRQERVASEIDRFFGRFVGISSLKRWNNGFIMARLRVLFEIPIKKIFLCLSKIG